MGECKVVPVCRSSGTDGSARILEYNGESILYSLVRSDRRTIAIQVKPDGSVTVRAPRFVQEREVAAFALSRAVWVVRHRERFARQASQTVEHTFTAGDTFRYLAEEYSLVIRRGARRCVHLESSRIVVTLRGEPAPERVQRALDLWRRQQALEIFAERLGICWACFARPGETMPAIRVKAMRSRWGSLSAEGAMSLNVHLTAMPIGCIDYVIYHELCHLRIHGHGVGFYQLLDIVMPEWRSWKRYLENTRLL